MPFITKHRTSDRRMVLHRIIRPLEGFAVPKNQIGMLGHILGEGRGGGRVREIFRDRHSWFNI